MHTALFLFFFGTIIGSFLNVVSLRLNSGLSLSGRSQCPHCGRKLKPLDLVPILSFVFLKGRCRECKSRISWQYPLVELWTGLLFVTLYDPFFSTILNALVFAVFSLYVAITVYDIRHQIIPDNLVYASIMLSFVFRLLSGGDALDFLAGPILAFIFASIWFLSAGKAMGFGDSKLALSIGLLLGGALGFSAVISAFWIGAAFGIALLTFSRFNPLLSPEKKITIKSAIPFAPFLVLGAWLSLILQMDLLHVSIF